MYSQSDPADNAECVEAFRRGQNNTFVLQQKPAWFVPQTECEHHKVGMYVKRRLVGTHWGPL